METRSLSREEEIEKSMEHHSIQSIEGHNAIEPKERNKTIEAMMETRRRREEEMEEIKKKYTTPLSLCQLILGIVLAVIGYQYSYYYHMDYYFEDNLCPNGAAWWLWCAGIILVVSQFLKLYFYFCALSLEYVTFILNVGILTWGSVLVFGAWASWTSDFDTYKTNREALNFCNYIPMMVAFIIILIGWVLVTAVIFFLCGVFCSTGDPSAEAATLISENSEQNTKNLSPSSV